MSEEEGEFKKRLEEEIKRLEKLTPNTRVYSASALRWVQNELLEDAKKEFPWFLQLAEGETISDRDYYLRWKLEVHQWAKKWLGR